MPCYEPTAQDIRRVEDENAKEEYIKFLEKALFALADPMDSKAIANFISESELVVEIYKWLSRQRKESRRRTKQARRDYLIERAKKKLTRAERRAVGLEE